MNNNNKNKSGITCTNCKQKTDIYYFGKDFSTLCLDCYWVFLDITRRNYENILKAELHTIECISLHEQQYELKACENMRQIGLEHIGRCNHE